MGCVAQLRSALACVAALTIGAALGCGGGSGADGASPSDSRGGDDTLHSDTVVDGAEASTDADDDAFDCTMDDVVDGGVADDGGSADAAAPAGPQPPTHLRCTGLYASWSAKTLAPGVREYAPGVPLWSDGASKTRWILLPAGTQIDTTDMDEWRFPVGTKVWKEFRLGDARVETRLFWKAADAQWVFTTYRWSADESTAVRLDDGETNVMGTGYEVPSHDACSFCHTGHSDMLLGVEAVSLGLPGATGVTLATLKSEGLLSTPPVDPTTRVPDDAGGTAAPALLWMHANCGNACHSSLSTARAGFTALHLRLHAAETIDVASPTLEATDAYSTAVGQPTRLFMPPTDGGTWYRVQAQAPDMSAVYVRAASRVAGVQMPPIDTHKTDDTGLATLAAWIAALPTN